MNEGRLERDSLVWSTDRQPRRHADTNNPWRSKIHASLDDNRFLFGGFPAVVEYNSTSQNFLTR